MTKIDLDDYMDILSGAHRYERYIHAKCPFHSDNRPSFFVYEDRYHCAACSRNGRTENLMKELGRHNIIPSSYMPTERLDNPWKRWLKSRSLGETLHSAWRNLPSIYMREERKIPDETQRKLGIGIMEDWITFPIRNKQGKIVGATARAGKSVKTQSKYIIPAGQDPNLLYVPSWERVEKSHQVYLVFGIIDAVTLYLLGEPCISTTTGLQLDHTVLDSLRKYIFFIPDIGEERQAHKIASKLGWRGKVMKCNYPDGTKDVNDVWVKYPNILRKALGVDNG